MGFELDKVINNISEVLERYDKGDIKLTEATGIMILELRKVSDYYAANFDDLNDNERTRILIVIYSINETIAKMYTEFNNDLDKHTGGFLSGRKDILNFDFSWDKEE